MVLTNDKIGLPKGSHSPRPHRDWEKFEGNENVFCNINLQFQQVIFKRALHGKEVLRVPKEGYENFSRAEKWKGNKIPSSGDKL